MTEKELYNVLKLQNQVDCTREEVFDLHIESVSENLVQVSKICAELPRTKSGKVKIDQFMKLPILSEEAFKAIDKNRFAHTYITKNFLKKCDISSGCQLIC